jgi:hypothetical protein
MATATLNPFITSISGRIGSIVFYRRQGKTCIRSYVIPRNPDTAAQKAVRRSFADAVKSWQVLRCEEKYKFIRKAQKMQMSGYNLYISTFMKERFPEYKKPSSVSVNEIRVNFHGYKLSFPSVSPSNMSHIIGKNKFWLLQYKSG